MNENQTGNAEEVWRQLLGFVTSQSIGVAAELELADHLAAGEADVADLAARVGADPRALYGVLRLLASPVFRT